MKRRINWINVRSTMTRTGPLGRGSTPPGIYSVFIATNLGPTTRSHDG